MLLQWAGVVEYRKLMIFSCRLLLSAICYFNALPEAILFKTQTHQLNSHDFHLEHISPSLFLTLSVWKSLQFCQPVHAAHLSSSFSTSPSLLSLSLSLASTNTRCSSPPHCICPLLHEVSYHAASFLLLLAYLPVLYHSRVPSSGRAFLFQSWGPQTLCHPARGLWTWDKNGLRAAAAPVDMWIFAGLVHVMWHHLVLLKVAREYTSIKTVNLLHSRTLRSRCV